MSLKGSSKSLPVIAGELTVDAGLEGSVQQSDGRVKIRLQLLHAPTDTHLWARDYERELADVLKLQNEVAREVAEQIRVQIMAAAQDPTRSPGGLPVSLPFPQLDTRIKPVGWNSHHVRTREGLRMV